MIETTKNIIKEILDYEEIAYVDGEDNCIIIYSHRLGEIRIEVTETKTIFYSLSSGLESRILNCYADTKEQWRGLIWKAMNSIGKKYLRVKMKKPKMYPNGECELDLDWDIEEVSK